jgi:hypothetical protein
MKNKSKVKSRIRSLLWDFIHSNKWQDLDDFSLRFTDRLLEIANKSPLSTQNILDALDRTRTNFFLINKKIRKRDFARLFFSQLSQIDLSEYTSRSRFETAKNFISTYLEVGYDKSKFTEERDLLVAKFGSFRNPHAKLLTAFETFLQKIAESFQVVLHGTKEYSGVDITKKIEEATIGFQIKSVNDDISEDKIRSQTSKALEYCLDGFVWIYGRPMARDLDTSIQAAYHHFKRINEKKKMYCTLIHPELLAEMFRKYEVNLE